VDELKIEPPLPGETQKQYDARVNFETDDDGRTWCRVCGSLIRSDEWRNVHYEAIHAFRGF
jgi:hypothetical protein